MRTARSNHRLSATFPHPLPPHSACSGQINTYWTPLVLVTVTFGKINGGLFRCWLFCQLCVAWPASNQNLTGGLPKPFFLSAFIIKQGKRFLSNRTTLNDICSFSIVCYYLQCTFVFIKQIGVYLLGCCRVFPSIRCLSLALFKTYVTSFKSDGRTFAWYSFSMTQKLFSLFCWGFQPGLVTVDGMVSRVVAWCLILSR